MFGNYSKLIGALVGNVVAIAVAYLATSVPGVASCTTVEGVETCVAFGFSQAQITAFLMTVVNSVFVYMFPPNKAAVRAFSLVFLAVTVAALSACSLSNEQQVAAAKAYDKTCAVEPAVYQTFVTVAMAKQASERTMAKAAAIHAAAQGLCETRPTDIFTASVQVANLYAQLVTISAQFERTR